MNGKHIQFKGRSVISLLLAVLILVIAVSPVLAEEDAGGGTGPGRSQTAILDDEMGFLSLKASYHAPVSGGVPIFAQVTDEELGFVSLQGAQPSSAILASAPASDEEMGFLSLKGAQHLRQPTGSSLWVVVDDEAMGYFSLKVARQFYADYGRQAAIARVQ